MKAKTRRIGLRAANFIALFLFAALILTLTFLFQTVFFRDFYRSAMKKQMLSAAEQVNVLFLESDGQIEESDLAPLSRNSQMSILIYKISENESGTVFPQRIVMSTPMGSISDAFSSMEYRSLLRLLYRDATENDGRVFHSYVPEESSESEKTQLQAMNARLLFADTFAYGGVSYMTVCDTTLRPTDAWVKVLNAQFLPIAAIVLVLTVFLSLHLSENLSRPLRRINRAAKNLPTGIYDNREKTAFREIAELSDTLSSAASELSKTNRFQKELISNVSHDLRTPLTMIVGYSELMRDMESERTPENMQVVIDEAERLSGIVNDLLTLSHYQSGSPAPEHKECFDLAAEVTATVERYRRMKAATGFRFTCDAGKPACVFADKSRILQVFCNLMNNAINYSGASRDIEISCRTNENNVTVAVTDHGLGIPESDLSNVFDRYYVVNSQSGRSRVGSGIGLSIVKTVLAEYDTECHVESRVGEGSTFSFSLPLAEKAE